MTTEETTTEEKIYAEAGQLVIGGTWLRAGDSFNKTYLENTETRKIRRVDHGADGPYEEDGQYPLTVTGNGYAYWAIATDPVFPPESDWGYYLDFNGDILNHPATHFPVVEKYKGELSKFAHEVDMFHREHHDETNAEFIRERFEILIGDMWGDILAWELLPGDPTDQEDINNWRWRWTGIKRNMDEICYECGFTYFLRVWTMEADVPAFVTYQTASPNNALHAAGYQAGFTNRDTSPWSPKTTAKFAAFGTEETVEEAKEGARESFWLAVAYYDNHEGLRTHS